jgi:hypothetical protein
MLGFDVIPTDCSIAVAPGATGPACFYLPQPQSRPATVGAWTGAVEKGSSVNCEVSFLGSVALS